MSDRSWLRRGLPVGLAVALILSSVVEVVAGTGARPAGPRDDGVAADTIPVFLASPVDVVFAGRLLSTTSAPQTITFTNTTPNPQTIATVTLAGTDLADFAIAGQTCTGGPIAPAGACTVDVTFTPSILGDRVAGLLVCPWPCESTQ